MLHKFLHIPIATTWCVCLTRHHSLLFRTSPPVRWRWLLFYSHLRHWFLNTQNQSVKLIASTACIYLCMYSSKHKISNFPRMLFCEKLRKKCCSYLWHYVIMHWSYNSSCNCITLLTEFFRPIWVKFLGKHFASSNNQQIQFFMVTQMR